MGTSGLSLKVSDFRAVKSAEIELDSISVLAGVNACGKSTLAHLFHSIVNLNAIYQRSLTRYAWEKISPLVSSVCEFRWQLEHPGEVSSLLVGYDARSRFDKMLDGKSFDDVLTEFRSFLDETLSLYAEKAAEESVSRACTAFLRTIGMEKVGEIRPVVSAKIEEVSDYYAKAVAERDYGAFLSGDARSRNHMLERGNISFLENGSEVYSTVFDDERKTAVIAAPLKALYGVSRAIYIESPWKSMPDVKIGGRLDFHDGFAPVAVTEGFKPDDSIFDVLAGRVDSVKSDVSKVFRGLFGSDEVFNWKYTRTDGEVFELSECATGIKALSILNVLYTKGLLDSKTLLIIDEPEAHLHPQWIVEYAKILVLLAKRLKVRMLLASHSPDMVGALRTVAKAEQLPGVRFYLADNEETSDKFRFTYRNLGLDVGPIFRKFNKVIDWMDMYAAETVSQPD